MSIAEVPFAVSALRYAFTKISLYEKRKDLTVIVIPVAAVPGCPHEPGLRYVERLDDLLTALRQQVAVPEQ
jgi:hypothetical protein